MKSAKTKRRSARSARQLPELKDGSLKIIILLFAVLLTVVAAAVAFSAYAISRGGWISVRGESPYTSEEIVTASGLEGGRAIFSDTRAAGEKIVAAKPYIREARVSRLLFFIVINVKADEPEYFLEVSGDYFITSGDLRVIDRLHSESEAKALGAVRLELPDLSTAVVGRYAEYGSEGKNGYVTEMLELIKSKEYADAVTEIGLASQYDDAYITFYDRCRIVLGSINGFEEKMNIAQRVLEDNRDSIYGGVVINVSDPDRPTCKPVDSLD